MSTMTRSDATFRSSQIPSTPDKYRCRSAVRTDTVVGLLLALAITLPLLQYSALLASHDHLSPRYKSIPVALVILAVLFLYPAFGAVVRRLGPSWLRVIVVTIVAVSLLITAHSMISGATLSFLSPAQRLGLVILLALGIPLYYLLALRGAAYATCLLIPAVIVALFTLDRQFDTVFAPGRPLWNIRHAGELLAAGHWIYQYHSGLSPAYPPLLFIGYVPLAVTSLDIRWANVLGIGLIVLLLYRFQADDWPAVRVSAVIITLLSVNVVFSAMTTQLVFYWAMLVVLIVAAAQKNTRLEAAALVLACLARPLAWPLALPWLLRRLHTLGATGQDSREGAVEVVRGIRSWSGSLPGLAALSAVTLTFLTLLVNVRAFVWSTLVLPNSDADRALHGLPQPSGAVALTPLLPWAQNHTLVGGIQVLAVASVLAILWKTGTLFNNPARAYVLTYSAFLVLNYVVYTYYWTDVTMMLVGTAVACPSGERAEASAPTGPFAA